LARTGVVVCGRHADGAVHCAPADAVRAFHPSPFVVAAVDLNVGDVAVAVPEPLITPQVCAGLDGCAEIVTLYAVLLGKAVAKVKVPLAFTARLFCRLSCKTSPPAVPARLTTLPPMVNLAGGAPLLLQPANAKEEIARTAANFSFDAVFIAEVFVLGEDCYFATEQKTPHQDCTDINVSSLLRSATD
jgi:hypothetical protein